MPAACILGEDGHASLEAERAGAEHRATPSVLSTGKSEGEAPTLELGELGWLLGPERGGRLRVQLWPGAAGLHRGTQGV